MFFRYSPFFVIRYWCSIDFSKAVIEASNVTSAAGFAHEAHD
jgi:hypothetical protein